MDANKHCLNCGTAIAGPYCHQCGQIAAPGKITFKDTIKEFLSSSFSFEGPLMGTILMLVKNPGKVYREFIAGKRKSYYKPVSFFVLLTAVYIILRALLNYDPLEGQFRDVPDNTTSTISQSAARYMVQNINYIMFFLVFAIGFAFKIFFRKKYNLAEYTTIGFYIAGLYVIVGTIIMFINNYTTLNLNQLQLVILIVLIFHSSYSLFSKINFWLAIKYLLVSILSLFLYIMMGFGFSVLVVSL